MKTWKLAGALLALTLFTLGSASLAADFSGVVNVNTATVEELEQLPGIGASRARALVEARERRGGEPRTAASPPHHRRPDHGPGRVTRVRRGHGPPPLLLF
jgi:hypothetical protein